MPDEILVTGATGFLGRRLVDALKRDGHEILPLSQKDGDLSSAQLNYPGVKHIFHLAARTFVPDSWKDPRPFYELNVMGTLNVLEFAKRQGASVTLVSSYVYGPPQHLPISEDHPLAAFNPYSQTKIMAEELARFYQSHHAVKVVVVRPFNLYGPGQDSRFLIPTLVGQFLDPAIAEVQVADVRPKRDYIHVDDCVALLTKTLAAEAHGAYNAGSGTSVSVGEVAAVIREACHSQKPLISREQERSHEVLDVVADISRARQDLDWMPAISLEEGLAELVRSHPTRNTQP